MKYALLIVGLVLTNFLVWGYLLTNQPETLITKPTNETLLTENLDEALIASPINKDANIFVPILMYHYIRDYQNLDDPLGIQLSVSPNTFNNQMMSLKKAGYQTISLTQFATRNFTVPKPIIITFDDGYLDQFTNAVPILESLGFKATFFIVRDFVGRDGYMGKEELNKLRILGMELGGHSLSHRNLSTMEYERQVYDISQSLVGLDWVFSYPAGKYSPVTLDIVDGLNIKAAVTTNIGVATELSSLYELPRIRVGERTDILRRINEEIARARDIVN